MAKGGEQMKASQEERSEEPDLQRRTRLDKEPELFSPLKS